MIWFVLLPGHLHTLASIVGLKRRLREHPVNICTYRGLLEAEEIPPGTWIFGDLERLAVWELRLAGEVARLMRKAGPGFRVLNDPARAAARYELLLRLHEQGFNQFRAWRAEDGIPPARYPVFLRLESNHKWPLSNLIHTPKALAAQLAAIQARGTSRRGVLIVEYQADELVPGVFRKFGAYRFGDRIVADHLVHDVTWLAKYGNPGAWSEERFAEEAAYVRDNPHAEALMRAFEIGGIEYGRADYGMVDGVPQIWEINTNPVIPSGKPEKGSPLRAEATIISRDNRFAALGALDTAGEGPPLKLESDILAMHRKRQSDRHKDMIRE